jgi:hypothetical protein
METKMMKINLLPALALGIIATYSFASQNAEPTQSERVAPGAPKKDLSGRPNFDSRGVARDLFGAKSDAPNP